MYNHFLRSNQKNKKNVIKLWPVVFNFLVIELHQNMDRDTCSCVRYREYKFSILVRLPRHFKLRLICIRMQKCIVLFILIYLLLRCMWTKDNWKSVIYYIFWNGVKVKFLFIQDWWLKSWRCSLCSLHIFRFIFGENIFYNFIIIDIHAIYNYHL